MTKDKNSKPTPTCGVIMPISKIDGLDEAHWKDVYQLISEVIDEAGIDPKLVSDANDAGIIQKNIIVWYKHGVLVLSTL